MLLPLLFHTIVGTNRVNDAVHPSYEQVETKLKKLSDKLKEGIMILIDIGTLSWSKENRAYLKHVSQILINCYESKIVIAVTSGDGMCAKLDDTDWLQIKNLTSHYAAHELLNFSEAEATLYLEERKKYKDVGIDTENMKTIKRLTCYNPYLLNLLSHHGLMYRSRFYALSHDYIRRHVNSIFMDLKVFSELQAFCRDHMDSLYHWGYKADNEIPTDLAQLRQFINSWGAKQYILYEQINKEHFFVINALPCLNLLLQEVTHRITEGQESIPDVPSVKGFAYEEKYFKQFVGGSVSLVGRNETTTVRATVAGVLNQEVINENLVVGSLYHVKFTYPVIDGVGCLRVDGSHALVFVQVSRSKYVEHSTKSSHLENPAPENPAVSILDHCRQKAPPDISRIIYLYVSPHSSFKGKPNERTAIAAKQARGTGAAQTIVRTGAVAKGKQKGDRIMQKTVGKMQKTDGIMTRSKHAELQVARSLQVEYFEHQFF